MRIAKKGSAGRCPTLPFSVSKNLEASYFTPKTSRFSCHCEPAARPWQSESQRYGIPHRSTGVRSKKESLSQKTWICCLVPRSLSSLQGSVSSRASTFRFGTTNRSVKDCRVGRKSCALLAMTNLIGFAEKRNNFRNGTFEKRCRAAPRKK